jgi:hypothetical protein
MLGLPRGTTWNHTTHNPKDNNGQLTGFGELFADVGSDSSDEGMAEGRSDGWIDERNKMDAWVVESPVGHSNGGFQ